MKVIGIIPARYESTRFPGKPLALINGKPMIVHVVERCKRSEVLSEVIVATDDDRIRRAVAGLCRVEMTSRDHATGTDRIAEVAARVEADVLINIQGDEPLIDPVIIDKVANALNANDLVQISTAASVIHEPTELSNPNIVKVVVDRSGIALYFSRYSIPFLRELADASNAEKLSRFRYLKHIGIYGFRKDALLRFVSLDKSLLEEAEKLEQLRALENGMRIIVVEVAYNGVPVDTPSDIKLVENQLLSSNRINSVGGME